MSRQPRRVVVLAGGIGGARLVDGLAAVLGPDELTIVVNTGDDFEHLGLWISPDVDTVMYTLAGLSDRVRGWGLAGETFRALEGITVLGGPDWFGLGDRDLATHLVRSDRRRRGERLTDITLGLSRALGVVHRILPMSDSPRPTLMELHDGRTLDFQRWLVAERAVSAVRRVASEGAASATPEVIEALHDADLVVLGPSNPYVSIDPILDLTGVRAIVARKPTVALSPIVAGRAVKGPLAAMLRDVSGLEPSAASVLAHYGSLIGAYVVELGDEAGVAVPVMGTRTIMSDRDDRACLAREVLDFATRTFG